MVGRDVGGVDLRHDERHVGVHAEGVGVVHAHGTAADGLRQERAGRGVVGRAEDDVNALEGVGLGQAHGHVLAGKAHGLARVDGALARQRHELAHGEAALLEALEHLLAHHAGGAQDGNGLLAHGGSFLLEAGKLA